MNEFRNSEALRTRESSEIRGEIARNAAEKINEFERTLFAVSQKLEGLRELANAKLKKKIDKTLKKIDTTLALAKNMKNIATKNVGQKVNKFVKGQEGFVRRLEKQLTDLTAMIAPNEAEVDRPEALTGKFDTLEKSNPNEEEGQLVVKFDEKAGKKLNKFLQENGYYVDFSYFVDTEEGSEYKLLDLSTQKQEPGIVNGVINGSFIVAPADKNGDRLNLVVKFNDGETLFLGPLKNNSNLGDSVAEAIKPLLIRRWIGEMEQTNFTVGEKKYSLGRKINVNNGGIYPLVEKFEKGGTVDIAAVQVEVWKNGLKLKVLAKDSSAVLEQTLFNKDLKNANDLSGTMYDLIKNFLGGKAIEQSMAANEGL